MTLKVDFENKIIIVDGPINLQEFLDVVSEEFGEEEELWTIVPELKYSFVN